MARQTSLEAEIRSYIPFLTTAGLCDRNAREFSDKEALVDLRRRLTWREVQVLANKLALTLRDLGLSKDRPLLVQLPNCVELFLARIACEKAGVACVTASPAFKALEIRQILEHTKPGAAMIFRSYRNVDYLSQIKEADNRSQLEIFVVGDDVPRGALSIEETFRKKIDSQRVQELLEETALGPMDSCQIATTSGSSGLPKCVEVSIYSRLLTGFIHAQRFALKHIDTIAPFGTIVSGTSEALGYFGVSLLGARAVLVDHFNPEEVFPWIAAEGVTFACMVPTMVAKIADLLPDLPLPAHNLRGIATYGSVLPIPFAEKMEHLLEAKIVQGYGTMDFGGIAASSVTDKRAVRIGTVGRPLDGNEVIICGDNGERLAPGNEGYIRVRGIHAVGRYYRSPELDEGKWKHGYFDVGEIGRFDKEGNLIILGRSDNVIIRGGQNIYPEDIEALLARHPGIHEVAVVGVPDLVYGQKLCAFIVVRSGWKLSVSDTVDFLMQRGIAHFKIPETILFVPDLPRVSSGEKVNKKELANRAREFSR